MILEQAVLHVRPGSEDEFIAAFEQARSIIASMPGFIDLDLSRCLEDESVFLLLVQWEALEDHTEGFRRSPEYQQWRRLLHHFYDPFPEVLHFAGVASA
ncbi:antibiotic biosynthesis monooxygenase family protein [Nocardioides terrisoli]|uniref:antibiotic biosynthesis monooxygenase family protein n=1 Tax=Nocardioides terrisoli TaxID=3388267 RepID=UPI00287B95FE|nr:antibiotic biosynthesis monooxygenase [Nocardioides marmorisolisilvae]